MKNNLLSALGGALLMLLILSIVLNVFQFERGKNCMPVPNELPALDMKL